MDRLEPLFATEHAEHLNVETVVQAIGTTFDDAALAATIVQANLQPDAVLHVLEQRHSRLDLMFSDAERELYRRALRLGVPCLVGLANRLPGFDVAQAQGI